MRYMFAIIGLGISLMWPGFSSAAERSKAIVGGNCNYEGYEGSCSIDSVDKKSKLSFFSFAGVVRGSEISFGGNLAEKVIRQGTKAPCKLMLMKSGTCTPCMIEGEKISGGCGGEAYSALFRKKK